MIGLATFLLTLGDSLWFRYAPRYLEALGASVIVIGLWGSLSDFLDAAWQYPGGLLADRAGRKRALLVLTGLSLLGILVFLVPYWPVVLFGLAFYMAEKAYAQPATFAVIADALPKERRAMGFVVQSVLKRVPILVGAPLAGYLITAQLGVVNGVRAGLVVAALVTIFALYAQWRYYYPPARPLEVPVEFRLKDFSGTLRRLLLSDILIRMGESATKVFIVLYVVTELGFTDLAFGQMLALQTLVALAVYVPAARAADRGPRKPWVALTFLFFTLYPVAILYARSFLLLALAFVIGGLKEIGEPARKASIIDFAHEHHRGRVVGTYYAFRGFAIMPVAFLAGLLWVWNPAAPFWAGAGLSLAGLLLYVLSVRSE